GIRQVFILDDGNRRRVKAMARRLGVRYYGRTTNEHAKAGNMNNGLEHSRAEFVITLDADHIPLPHFLERTLGYFDDPKVAFVQTPQMFYNRECFLYRRAGGSWWSEQGMFYSVIQPAKNRWNAAFFVGTSAVVRRAALDSVGGFATGTATEDIHTSLRLHARGWKSVFVNEPLAYGLEAENLKEFYRQRRRWAAGSLGLLLRSPDSPLWARGLTLGQRLNYLSATLAHLQGAKKLFYFLLPPLCALTLAKPVTANLEFALPVVGLFLSSALWITSIYARGTYHLIHTEAYGLANAMAHVGGLWGVIKVQRKFAVSRKNIPCRERSWLNTILWLLLAIAIATLFRAVDLMTLGSTGTESDLGDLMIAVCICTGINLLLLLSFLSYLLAYERGSVAPPHARLPATEKHAYVEAMCVADRPASVGSGCGVAAKAGTAVGVKARWPSPLLATRYSLLAVPVPQPEPGRTPPERECRAP
ncbi:MAG: glycosyltransferase, partial [Chloroflexi bacterium]|nr:glycosyltransferase [Chloroflexota bacterium]